MKPSRPLVALAFWVVARELATGSGLVDAATSFPALVLLGAAGLLFAGSAVRAARTEAPAALRAARVLLRAGAALLVVALPASLATRASTTLEAGEGERFPAGDGLPALAFGRVTLAPRGPGLLSKTVDVEVTEAGAAAPVHVGLFPPATLGERIVSVLRFGYAPGVTLLGPDGAPIAAARVPLGTLDQTEETASLVRWTPETNLMMGAGTFPPRLEDLWSPPGTGLHVFLRMVRATLGGTPRDLTDPDAYRWLVDGRPEQAAFLVQVFRGRERVFDGTVPAGETAAFPGGSVALAPDVLLWVDLLATRDPWRPAVAAALAALAAGALLGAGYASAARIASIRRRRRSQSAAP